ncbi:MAG: glycosyltransferase family 39 protein [Solirubrobacteraceae bacterium]
MPLRDRLGRPEALVVAAVVGFVALTVWWVSQDHRVPTFDAGGHMFTALWFRDEIAGGDVLFPFNYYNSFGYAPLVQLIGAAATVIGGRSVTTLVLSQNLVFVPMLALGCYGAGTIAFGRRLAGALAAVFALGTPMLTSLLHIYMLDPPQTALVALAVWLLLASRRFERTGWAGAAGVAFGLGLLTKLTFAVFPAGLIAVMLLRGGWRHWKGMIAFAAPALVIGAPYYLRHASDVVRYAAGSNVSGTSLGDFGADPARFTFGDLGWYLWNAINVQLLLPFTVLVLVGVVVAIVRYARDRRPDDYGPELVGGLLVAYVVIMMLAHNDNRYLLPATVYMAVLGTGWIATLRSGTWRTVGAVAVVAIAVANVVMSSFGVGGVARASLPGARDDRILTGRFTLLSDRGFLVDEPIDGGNVGAILKAAHEQGARFMAIGRLSATEGFYNAPGLTALGAMNGIDVVAQDDPNSLGPRDIYVRRAALTPGGPRPCAVLPDGTGVFVTRGPQLAPIERARNLFCPTRSRRTYAAPGADAPLPAATRARLGRLERLLIAARRQGIREVGFEESVATDPGYGDGAALAATARRAGLRPPPGGRVDRLEAPHGVLVFARAGTGPNFPPPCIPNGETGVYLVRGHVVPQLEYAEALYCPTRTPPDYRGPLAG